MSQLYSSILKTIGRTPIVRLNNIPPKHVELYVKCEFFNPLGSVKDRIGIGMIEDAERRGVLKPGQTVFEGTAGNTGISVAMACAAKNYRCIITMPAFFSKERRKILKFLGADVIIPPDEIKAFHLLEWAKAICEQNGWFYCNQMHNSSNPEYHRSTTGPEILSAFASEGKKLDYFVSGWATGGTLSGAGIMLKTALPDLKIVTLDPYLAPMMEKGIYTPHAIEGLTPDFIPTNAEVGKEIYDELVYVNEEDAVLRSQQLGSEEGVFAGLSAGATVHAALEVANSAPEGSVILAMLPDTAERYLSTSLFDGISDESDKLEPHEDLSFDDFMPTAEELEESKRKLKESMG